MSVTISEANYNEILTMTGYPIVGVSDLGLTDEQIKTLLIFPAMRTYFRYFPIRSDVEYQIGEAIFSIDFPDALTFGVIDARLNTARYRGLSVTGSPFFNAQNIAIGNKRMGKYGTKNNYDFYIVKIMENMERQSTIDMNKAFRIVVDENNETVSGYSNVSGRLSITWAKYSEDFSYVSFNKFDDVKMLAQANILEYFGMLRSQQTTDVPNSLDPRIFLDKSEEMRDKVMTKFKEYSKVIMLR